MEKERHISLRLEPEMHEKLKSLSKFEGRSINSEIIYLIRKEIIKHEREFGELK